MSAGTIGTEARPRRQGRADRRMRADRQARLRPLVRAGAEMPAAVWMLIALAALLRFVGLGHQGFWFDEGNTALLAHFSLGKMLGLLPQSESTPPLYYLLAWGWARRFGFGEAGLRSLSALAGVLTVPLCYLAGSRLVSRRAGIVAAGLCACNPFLVWYSQEARSYALVAMLSAAGLAAFARARSDHRIRPLAMWAVISALSLATHYYAVLAVAPEGLWLLARHPRRRAVLAALGGVGACGLALLPLAITQDGTGHASWIGHIPLVPRLGQIVPNFLVGFQTSHYGVLEPLAAAISLGALAVLALAGPRERQGAVLAGALAVCGLVLNLVLIAAGTDDLITRNLIALWIPAAVCIAGGLGVARARAAGALATAVICATGVWAVASVASTRGFQRPDWRGVARVLGERSRPGSPGRALLVQHYRDLLPLSLYLPGLRWMPFGGVPVDELDVVSISAPRVHLCWWGGACNLSGSRMQRSYPVPGFHVVWERRAHQFTIMRLRASHPLRLTYREVAHVLHTTTLGRDELLLQRR